MSPPGKSRSRDIPAISVGQQETRLALLKQGLVVGLHRTQAGMEEVYFQGHA